jgi:hypothetical protein
MLAARNSRKRIEAHFLAAATSACGVGEPSERDSSRVSQLVAALIIQEAIAYRGFGRETLGIGFVDDVAALGTGVSVIFPIVSEDHQTLSAFLTDSWYTA